MRITKWYLFWFLIFSIVVFCTGNGSENCPNTQEFKVPPVQPADANGWEIYENPLTLTKESVKGLAPGVDSPEAAVVHFYASKIRGDDCYKDVLPADKEKLKRLTYSLQKMAAWKFREVTLLKREAFAPGKYWIKIKMTAEIEGKIESGTDEATVEKIAGKWYVTEPPT